MKVDVLGTTFTDIVVKTDYLNMKFDDLVFSKYAKIGNTYNGAHSSIEAIYAISVKGRNTNLVTEQLFKIDKWIKDNTIYEE